MEKKRMMVVFLTLLCLWLMLSDAAQDLTLVPDATGCLVVKASIEKIIDSNLFSKDHNYLLERLALVTDFGKNVFIDGAVGIWQMTESNLNEAKQLLGTLSSVESNLKQKFQINFTSLVVEDIRKPFYNLIIVCILIEGKQTTVPWRSDVQGQMNYWISVATNHNTEKFREKFTESAAVLERNKGERNSECLVCNQQPTDIVFVLDSSGSIGDSGWSLQLQFVNKVIDEFEYSLNRGESQVAIVVFTTSITLKKLYSSNVPAIRSSLASYRFSGGGNDILLGMNTAISIIKGSGSRKDDATVRKLVFLLTDGEDNGVLNKASEQLNQLQANVYAIGVTSGVNLDQLNTIASKPDYVKLYNNFAKFEKDIEGIVDASCKTASQLDFHDIKALYKNGRNCNLAENIHVCNQQKYIFQKNLTLESMQLHQSRSFELKMEPNKQAFLDIRTKISTLNVYTAVDYFPNEAIYDQKFVVHPESATKKAIKINGNQKGKNNGADHLTSKITVYVASADPECGNTCSEDVNTVLTFIDQSQNLLEFSDLRELEKKNCFVYEEFLDCTQHYSRLKSSLNLKVMQLHQTRHFELKVKPTQKAKLEVRSKKATLYVYTGADYYPTEEKYDQKVIVQPGSLKPIVLSSSEKEENSENGAVSFFTSVYVAAFDSKCGSNCSETIHTSLSLSSDLVPSGEMSQSGPSLSVLLLCAVVFFYLSSIDVMHDLKFEAE